MTAAPVSQDIALPGSEIDPIAPDIIKQIAMDIGKEVAHYIETMYPHAVTATSKNMLLSVRNCVYTEIIAALATTDETAILDRLARRKKHRRDINAMRRAGKELDRERQQNPPRDGDEAYSRVRDAYQRNGVRL